MDSAVTLRRRNAIIDFQCEPKVFKAFLREQKDKAVSLCEPDIIVSRCSICEYEQVDCFIGVCPEKECDWKKCTNNNGGAHIHQVTCYSCLNIE